MNLIKVCAFLNCKDYLLHSLFCGFCRSCKKYVFSCLYQSVCLNYMHKQAKINKDNCKHSKDIRYSYLYLSISTAEKLAFMLRAQIERIKERTARVIKIDIENSGILSTKS